MNFILANIRAITGVLAVVCAVAMAVAIYLVFAYAPMEAVMGVPQKIFYFHVPIAVMCYLGFFIAFASSIIYLWKGDLKWDRFAVSGLETGMLFATLVLLTGMLWGKPIWGAYWTWDPRLTTSFILWLIFAGCLVLRLQVDDETLRAKYSAIVSIIGFADVPLVHLSVKLWTRGIHPVIERGPGDPGMDPAMFLALKVSVVAIFLLFALVFILRVRYEFLKNEVEHLLHNAEQ